jgi:hypothetical protein
MKPKAAYAEIEILRAKLDSLIFKMDDEPLPKRYENNLDCRRYLDAKMLCDQASTRLLAALDKLRNCKAWGAADGTHTST